MQCLEPFVMKNPKYKNAPFQRPFLVVPCGHCLACRSRRSAAWSNRLSVEDKHSVSSWFVTLTYADEALPSCYFGIENTPSICRGLPQFDNVPTMPVLLRDDFQKFMKRLRSKTDINLKYYLAAEYGGETYRPHAHCIFFLDKVIDRDHFAQLLAYSWSFGHVRIDVLSPSLIRYATNYITKMPDEDSYYKLLCELGFPQFSLMSKRLGAAYIDDARFQHDGSPDSCYFRCDDGTKSILPRYYRDKLYDDRQKKRIADHLQDVLGIPEDIACDLMKLKKYLYAQKAAVRQAQVNDKSKKSRKNKI